MKYIFANWGQKIWVKNPQGHFVEGKITEFDPKAHQFNTKVILTGKNDGVVMWLNRDDVEMDMQERELFLMGVRNYNYEKNF